MDYQAAVEFLFDLRRFRPRPGTASTADLLEHLGDPHEDVRFVQVAGSNGKGSTARCLERICREAGLSVGLYTSPHLEDLRERVRVDGRAIPRTSVRSFVAESAEYVTERAVEGRAPTFFETVTAMALWYFGQRDVDLAVLEVGIGGRYDATSVVDPVASAVTSVTLEHTGIIGETIEEIARDKAHVAPAGRPLVTATEGEALAAVEDVSGAVLTVGSDADCDVTVEYGGRVNHLEATVGIEGAGLDLETRIPLLGAHQAENAGIAAALARQVADVDEGTVARGLRTSTWPGRFEVLEREPLVVLDGAHNPGACERLTSTLASFDYEDLHLVVGAMHDKDHAAMAAALPTAETVVPCEPAVNRAEDRTVLARVFESAGAGQVTPTDSVADAVDDALTGASENDCVLVTGSLFAVAEARRRWSGRQVPKRVVDRRTAADALERVAPAAAVDSTRQDEAIHRAVGTTVRPDLVAPLQRALARVGGDCVVGATNGREEPVEVLLLGTVAQLRGAADAIDGYELESVLEGSLPRTPETTQPWGAGPAVMGILNVTPDSFHDGGRYETTEDALERARAMVAAGADIVDVGGESTRPGADPVSVATECDRVRPVVQALADVDAVVSVDTRKAAVAEAALEAGADMINDVSGLVDPEMRFVAADHDVPLVVMHSLETPVDPERSVVYDDVVEDVITELGERVLLAEQAGLEREKIIVDPGLGFGKTAAESFELLGRVNELAAFGCPIMVGHSHKSMFGRIDRDPDERFAPSVAASALAVARGADIVRVHDVDATRAAVETVLAADD